MFEGVQDKRKWVTDPSAAQNGRNRRVALRYLVATVAIVVAGCGSQQLPISKKGNVTTSVVGSSSSGGATEQAPTIRQLGGAATTTASNGTLTVNFGSPTVNGNYLVLAVGGTFDLSGGNLTIVSPSGFNQVIPYTYQQQGGFGNNNNASLAVFTMANAPSISAVTLSYSTGGFGNNNQLAAIAYELNPANGTTSVTLETSGVNPGNSSTASVTTSGQSTFTSDLLLSFVTFNTNNNPSLMNTAPFSPEQSETTSNSGFGSTNITLTGLTATATSSGFQSFSGSLGNSTTWVAALLALETP